MFARQLKFKREKFSGVCEETGQYSLGMHDLSSRTRNINPKVLALVQNQYIEICIGCYYLIDQSVLTCI